MCDSYYLPGYVGGSEKIENLEEDLDMPDEYHAKLANELRETICETG